MKKYIIENKKSIVSAFLITIMLYIIRLTQYSFSIDTEILINDPDSLLNSWYIIGRYGLCFFKSLFHTKNINIFLTNIVAIFFLISNAILWMYLYSTISNKKGSQIASFVFMLMITSSPILCEQIGFTLQALEIMLALNIEAISILFANKGIENKNKIFLLLSIICLFICFSFYQAYVFLYMTGIISCLLLKYDIDEIDYKDFFYRLGMYILIFLLAFLSYYCINILVLSYLDLTKGTYLANQIKWGVYPVFVNMKNIMVFSFKTLIGYQNTWHPFFGLLFIIFFYYYCLSKKCLWMTKTFKIFLCISFFVIPFLLIFLTGSQTAGRAQFSIVYSLAFLSWWLLCSFERKKTILLLSCVILLLQCCIIFILNLSAYNCFREETKLIDDISQEIIKMNYENKQIAFIGEYNPNSYLKGETLGHSFFEWDKFDGKIGNGRVPGFFKALKYDYVFVDENQLSILTEKVKNKETWFENHQIYLINDVAVVKLS